MNRRHHFAPQPFSRLLGWTFALALVFSAGLITGQRILKHRSLPPLVSISGAEALDQSRDAVKPAARSKAPRAKDSAMQATEFSFYDSLTSEKPLNLHAAQDPDAPQQAERHSDNLQAATGTDLVAKVSSVLAAGQNTALPSGADNPLPARYVLQVAAYPSLERARSEISRLRKMGLEPHVVAAEVPEKGTFFRVRIGRFHTMDEARLFQGDLRHKYELETFITPI